MRLQHIAKTLAWLLATACLCGCDDAADNPTTAGPSPAELDALAVEAYIYGYPLVAAYAIVHKQSLEPASADYKGPFNHYRADVRLMTAADRTIISPNADTPYGLANLDLRGQGQVLSVPAIDTARYFSIQMVDMHTFNFAYLGKRATSNRAGTYLICYPGNYIPAPAEAKAAGIDSIICAETPFVQLFSRTQLYDDADLGEVLAINSLISLRPLSDYMPQAPRGTADGYDGYDGFPAPSDDCLATPEFFSTLDFVLSLCPVHPSEQSLRERLKSLGLDGSFSYSRLSAEQKAALDYGIREGRRQIAEATAIDTRKLFGSRGEMEAMNGGDIYLMRALGAFYGIYGNTASEALYFTYRADADGAPLDASSHDYRLTFAMDALPPVDAFWSATMYGADKFFVDNPLDRYLINSRILASGQLHTADGRLTIHIQKEAPADPDDRKNWLPAPDGPFTVILRLFLPQKDAIAYKWNRPQIETDTRKDTAR